MQDYLNEAVDLKRFALLNRKRIWIVLLGALLGVLIFGGVYYIKAAIMSGPDMYRCKALYYITFDTEEFEAVHDYYNDFTWNEVLDSDKIMGKAAEAIGADKQYMAEISVIPTMSDIRFIWVYFEDEDISRIEAMQEATGQALVNFALEEKGFTSIERWDGPITEKIEVPLLVTRNLVFGVVVGVIAGVLVLIYLSARDSSVYTYEDFYNRFGIYPIGMIFGKGKKYCDERLADNLAMLCSDKDSKKINLFRAEALNEVTEKEFEVEEFEKNVLPDGVSVNMLYHENNSSFISEAKSGAPGIMLVSCGKDDYGSLSRAVNNAKLMGIEVAAYILVDGDEAIYNAYYRVGR